MDINSFIGFEEFDFKETKNDENFNIVEFFIDSKDEQYEQPHDYEQQLDIIEVDFKDKTEKDEYVTEEFVAVETTVYKDGINEYDDFNKFDDFDKFHIFEDIDELQNNLFSTIEDNKFAKIGLLESKAQEDVSNNIFAYEQSIEKHKPQDFNRNFKNHIKMSFDKDEVKTNDKKHNKKVTSIFTVLFGSIFFGLSLGVALPITSHIINMKKINSNNTIQTPYENSSINTSQNTNVGFAGVVANVIPSLVCITSNSEYNSSFWGVQEDIGAGSGIIFEQDNNKVYIVTNDHVVKDATRVGVMVSDATQPVPASLIGRQSKSDIAVISINKKDLVNAGATNIQVVKFGISDKMNMGDFVLVMGNALGEGNTSTLGIISATDKHINVDGIKLVVMQTDATINQGNSGGALVNIDGEVIGINTAKYNKSLVEGTGYSIGSDIFKPIIDTIMQQIDKGTIGVDGFDITEEYANANQIAHLGFMVENVAEGSPAHKAGIMVNDIIVEFNHMDIFSNEQLENAIIEHKVGETVSIKIIRNSTEEINLNIIIEESPKIVF